MENQANNELQQAIDDITKGGNVGASEAAAATSDLEAKIQSQMGVPPMPQTEDVPMNEVPAEMPLPEKTEGETAQNKVTPTVTVNDAPVQSVPVSMGQQGGAAENDVARAVVAPVVNTEQKVARTMGNNITVGEQAMADGSLKEQMLRDLFPLMDKVELSPERRYEIYKEMLTTDHDLNMVQGAYEAAKALPDEKAKAEALLYLLDLV